MRRLALFFVAGFMTLAALSLSTPPDLDPDPGVPTTLAEEVQLVSRFFHCPWALANDRNDSSYVFMTGVETQFSMTYLENGSSDEGQSGAALRGSAVSIDNTRVLGASAAIVEFADGPAAAAVVTIGDDGLAGDVCSSNLPAVWHVAGGSTREGETLTLRLFNPFADDARVNLSAVSELGTEANDSFQSVSVPARSTRTFSLEVELPGREALSVFVDHIEGSVIPVIVQSTGSDLAMWPGTRHSQVWEFPLVTEAGLETELVLTNYSPIEVTFSIEVFDESATVLIGETGTISGPGQTRVALADVAAETYGLRITADGPFGAVVVGRGDRSVVATVGSPTVSDVWLVPGPNAESRAGYRMWFLNTGVDPVTVSYRKANATGSGDVATIEVAAGAVASVVVTDIATTGIEASGTGPFSAAWSAEFDGRRMFSGAVPIGE